MLNVSSNYIVLFLVWEPLFKFNSFIIEDALSAHSIKNSGKQFSLISFLKKFFDKQQMHF